MNISIQLTCHPIDGSIALPAELSGYAGAWAEFRGNVRGDESGQPITALEYEAYGPMAIAVMRQIALILGETHPFLFFQAIHRVGIVPVGEAAIYVGVAAKHRANAFWVLAGFMDRLKQDVPIWKTRSLPAQMPGRSDLADSIVCKRSESLESK